MVDKTSQTYLYGKVLGLILSSKDVLIKDHDSDVMNKFGKESALVYLSDCMMTATRVGYPEKDDEIKITKVEIRYRKNSRVVTDYLIIAHHWSE